MNMKRHAFRKDRVKPPNFIFHYCNSELKTTFTHTHTHTLTHTHTHKHTHTQTKTHTHTPSKITQKVGLYHYINSHPTQNKKSDRIDTQFLIQKV